jgi:hypothetical protein
VVQAADERVVTLRVEGQADLARQALKRRGAFLLPPYRASDDERHQGTDSSDRHHDSKGAGVGQTQWQKRVN